MKKNNRLLSSRERENVKYFFNGFLRPYLSSGVPEKSSEVVVAFIDMQKDEKIAEDAKLMFPYLKRKVEKYIRKFYDTTS